MTFVAVDPKTGLHLRPATPAEIEGYQTLNTRLHFDRPVLVGDVLVDIYTGPGVSYDPFQF
jgi:hypothetical protein